MSSLNKKIAEQTARLLFSIKAISFSPKKPFRFTSGMLSPIYLDNRIVISYPSVRKKIIDFYLNIIYKQIGIHNIEVISGTATAAIPNAMVISSKICKPMVYVEINKGEIHKSKLIGKLKKGNRVLIIEDHITTAGSLVGNVLTVRKAGGIAQAAIATTTYNMSKAKKSFKENKVKVFYLTTIKMILDVAIKDGFLKKKERQIVEKWTSDPINWGKIMGFE